jgi:tetratricopeptide (TPR) repeat protein
MAMAGTPSTVRAVQPVDDASTEDPMGKFEEAERLYRGGEHEAAIDLLRELLQAHDDPVLHYNLGRAYEGAKQFEEAIASYQRYLDGSPEAADRDAVRERIEDMQARLEAKRQAEKPPPATTQPVQPPALPPQRDAPMRPSAYLPWTMLGVGAAGLVTGGVLGILARRNRDEAVEAPRQADAADALQRARDQALGANVCFAVGGALAVAGITWGIVATVRHKRRSEAKGRPRTVVLRARSLGFMMRF